MTDPNLDFLDADIDRPEDGPSAAQPIAETLPSLDPDADLLERQPVEQEEEQELEDHDGNDNADGDSAYVTVPAPVSVAGPLPNLVPGAASFVTDQEQFEDLDGDADHDSAYGESLQSSEASISSEITKFRFENGRRYHAYRDGAYWAPNDEIHNDQQDMAHHLWLLTFDNQLYLAPIRNPQVSSLELFPKRHCLRRVSIERSRRRDWNWNMGHVSRSTLGRYFRSTDSAASDMADAFPSATVRGIDLSPIQPQWVPPNCIFELDDATLPWTFRPESYDFIHIREMFGSVGDWDELFSQAYQTLKPDGYLECAEHSVTPVSDDNTVGPDHVFTRYGTIMTDLSRKRGKDIDIWNKLKISMERAGFVDVVETRAKWPMNGWSSDSKMKELGKWNQLRVTQGIEGFAMRMLTTVGGWAPVEVQVLAAQIRAALKDKTVHGYLDVNVVYGRKPAES
ncbi:uncharacterized protein PAC_15947 [Phialocephala subalpina]|uniref:Methyltransferase n=1 Tax=Phialocephala subalpina TaxID=576137 RepID=A0A1L7XM65_9HELO|nr:uncharacterized protein PAC_15947 [Phialocephala subalpina]